VIRDGSPPTEVNKLPLIFPAKTVNFQAMHAEAKQVTEYHITCEALPKQKFVLRADSPETAAKKLIGKQPKMQDVKPPEESTAEASGSDTAAPAEEATASESAETVADGETAAASEGEKGAKPEDGSEGEHRKSSMIQCGR
jgi:hypothetical protein